MFERFGAFVYNTLAIPIAAGALYLISGLLPNPSIAGAAMAMSSVTVVSNANRLSFFESYIDRIRTKKLYDLILKNPVNPVKFFL